MEAIMKRLILAVCLLFTVLCGGFAKDFYPKTFATDTYIATKYDDGKIKYALTEDEIIKQVVYDYSSYFNGLIDNSKIYEPEGIKKIDIDSCHFFIMESDNVVYLKAYYKFLLLSSDYDYGIPLKERKLIIDKVLELSKEAWENIEDPIIDEIRGL